MKKIYVIIVILYILFFPLNDIVIASRDFAKTPIKVGGDNNYPPYEFVDDNNNFRGFNVDIIRAISIEQGLEIDLIPNSWEDTMSLLKKGEIDLIQGMTITPERERIYDFTEEIVMNSQNIFVLHTTSNISSVNDLKGKKVAIQAEDVTKEIISHIPDIVIIEKVNQMEALKVLLSGEVDAYVGNRLTGIYYVQSFGLTETVKIVGEPLYATKYSIAAQSGDDELLQTINDGLRAIKENGTYDKIYKKWFGETIPDINQKLRKLLYTTIVALIIALIFVFIVNHWNSTLKNEVESRTKEVLELNSIAMHNDKMQALGRLSAGIAHELRNPLTSIKAFIDLIPYKFEDKEFRNQFAQILPKEINRLNDLISSLLDFSKPTNPKPSLINLNNVLFEVLTLLKLKIKEKNINIIKLNTDISFYADESQTKQILINIILNCIDAIDYDGEIEIKGTLSDSKASIIIKDNGVGIPKDMLNNLFDPFYTSKKDGYGIGLSVTDRLIKENKGTIKLISQVDIGTEVTIDMPLSR